MKGTIQKGRGKPLLAGFLSAIVAGSTLADGDSSSATTGGMTASNGFPTSLDSVRLGMTAERTRLVFDLSDRPDFKVQVVGRPDVIRIEFADSLWRGEIPADLAGTPFRGLRHDISADGVAFIAELDSTTSRVEYFTLPPEGERGHRLVLDVYAETLGSGASEPFSIATASLAAPDGEGQGLLLYTSATADGDEDSGPLFRFDDDGDLMEAGSSVSYFGYGEFSGAYTVASPSRWSQLRGRFELGASGDLGARASYRLVGRVQGDAAYSVERDYYDSAVRSDQRRDAAIREAYVDFPVGEWEWRVGRQHVVWGEMVGLFLADVVSARDMREFYLQEFENMRIPQWAVRSEYFSGNSHFELLWVPHPSYDEIGKPGADFYPFAVPAGTPVRTERPTRNLSNTNAGIRYSHLISGWDLSGFYYQSRDVQPTLYQTEWGLELRNDRIRQTGFTFSKALPTLVFKGEAVHTSGRGFLSSDPASPYGLEESESLDYVVGVMVPWQDWRFDFQVYGSYLFDYEQGILRDRRESGLTFLLHRTVNDRLEWEILYMTGLNRTDYSWQPKLIWNLTQQWRMQLGADIFGGGDVGLFGIYDDSDRVYMELRRWF